MRNVDFIKNIQHNNRGHSQETVYFKLQSVNSCKGTLGDNYTAV